jgi:hypothetical protein
MVCWWLLVHSQGNSHLLSQLSKSISSGDQYVTLHPKTLFTSKYSFVYVFLEPHPYYWNSDSKQVGGGLLIANHLDQSLWWGQSETLRSCQIIFITHFPTGAHCCWAIYQLCANCAIMLLQNYFPEPNWPSYVHFSSSNFTVLDHILSTAGDALRTITCMQTANPATVNI